jgi:hypothetical protein
VVACGRSCCGCGVRFASASCVSAGGGSALPRRGRGCASDVSVAAIVHCGSPSVRCSAVKPCCFGSAEETLYAGPRRLSKLAFGAVAPGTSIRRLDLAQRCRRYLPIVRHKRGDDGQIVHCLTPESLEPTTRRPLLVHDLLHRGKKELDKHARAGRRPSDARDSQLTPAGVESCGSVRQAPLADALPSGASRGSEKGAGLHPPTGGRARPCLHRPM